GCDLSQFLIEIYIPALIVFEPQSKGDWPCYMSLQNRKPLSLYHLYERMESRCKILRDGYPRRLCTGFVEPFKLIAVISHDPGHLILFIHPEVRHTFGILKDH